LTDSSATSKIVEASSVEKGTDVSRDEQTIESLFQGLWDRVRATGELIGELRSSKKGLESRIAGLEAEVTSLRGQLAGHEETAKALKELQAAKASMDGRILSNGDREVLAEKAKKLLVRLQEYL
jgi:hypothetical protein